MTKVIPKKQLVYMCGLAGVGKRTTINALINEIANAFKIEKDKINSAFVGTLDINAPFYQNHIKNQTYDAMLTIGADNLLQADKIAILQGYNGDKLTGPILKPYLLSKEYEVKVIYFHCSGATQKSRIEARGEARDADKMAPNAFASYREAHIANHLRELTQVPHLLINTEDENSLSSNVQTIIQYLEQPSPAIELYNVNKDACKKITPEQAMAGADVFKKLVEQMRIQANPEYIANNNVQATNKVEENSHSFAAFTPYFTYNSILQVATTLATTAAVFCAGAVCANNEDCAAKLGLGM